MGLFSLDRLVVIFPEEAKGGAGGWRLGWELGDLGYRPSRSQCKLPVHPPGDNLLEFRVGPTLPLRVTWGELFNFSAL